MRAVVQRVKRSQVSVEGETMGGINSGLCVFLGVGKDDTYEDALYLAEKIVFLRIFPDAEDKMNLSLKDINGEILAVSQFTLFGDCRKGRRPGFSEAALPEKANELYEKFVYYIRERDVSVKTGVFRADMLVSIDNDGPVTMLLDSKKIF